MKYAILLAAATMGSCLPHSPSGQKLPFNFGLSGGRGCDIRGMRVMSCGTKKYCEAIDKLGSEDGRLHEDIRWSSTRECLDAHVPEPRNLPWKQPEEHNFCGSRGDESEVACGTEKYCNLFETKGRYKVSMSPYIWTKEQCLAAHQPNPDQILFPVD
ncbi:hypothetical protein X797_002962 [Metarhizium robertsii]|uniref:Uncharacterized protein n=2 Tax=Metarhizium robertsii TaxID=568076 RepID=E9EK23_METRA|nr:uncharacterized protein MAA_00108 [Metarhizium robertsii ARSEF 23]EFZ03034.1 hypothetical protein MAA_00108 [Metarhizium robertsii ARSEF 23]EXV05274.1 hypothetical protein X797_002962 [Metarhizium robertsii]